MTKVVVKKVTPAEKGGWKGIGLSSTGSAAVYGVFVDGALRAVIEGEREFHSKTYWRVVVVQGSRACGTGLDRMEGLRQIKARLEAEPEKTLAAIERAEAALKPISPNRG